MRLFKCHYQILRQIFIFCDFYFFLRKVRHNCHLFRHFGQKFFILENLSFKLWSRFHNGAAPERKLYASMWEI